MSAAQHRLSAEDAVGWWWRRSGRSWRSGDRVIVAVAGAAAPEYLRGPRLARLAEDCRDMEGDGLTTMLLVDDPELLLAAVADLGLDESTWPRNLWVGTTAKDQDEVRLRVPDIGRVPAVVRFLVLSPLLGRIRLRNYLGRTRAERDLDWVIAAGDASKWARPTHPGWAVAIADECVHARVPFYWEGNGAWEVVCDIEDVQAGAVVLDDLSGDLRIIERTGACHRPPTGPSLAQWTSARRFPGGTLLLHRIQADPDDRELDGEVWEQTPGVG